MKLPTTWIHIYFGADAVAEVGNLARLAHGFAVRLAHRRELVLTGEIRSIASADGDGYTLQYRAYVLPPFGNDGWGSWREDGKIAGAHFRDWYPADAHVPTKRQWVVDGMLIEMEADETPSGL